MITGALYFSKCPPWAPMHFCALALMSKIPGAGARSPCGSVACETPVLGRLSEADQTEAWEASSVWKRA